MMRSLYSGVSGLQVHQAKMDVIGNNIANVNTVGYKGSNVTFQEVFSQTLKGAGAPQGGRGGTNPQQIGLGASVGAINVNHAKGSTQRTDNPDDIMIDGNGFFIVSNDESALNRFYTRAGNFSKDKQGYLVTTGGFKVLDKDMQPVRINMSDTKEGTATSGLEIKGNINKSDAPEVDGEAVQVANVSIYDSLGGTHSLEIKFGEAMSSAPGTDISPPGVVVVPPATVAGQYTYRAITVGGALGTLTQTLASTATGTSDPLAGPPAIVAPLYAAFNSKGNFVGLYENITIDADKNITDPGTEANTFSYNLSIGGAEKITIPVNNTMFTNLTQYDKDSDLSLQVVDGAAAGSLDSYSIAGNGDVIGTFTNGQREVLATIGLASFDNNVGLMKVGNNMFVDTPNSGAARYGSPSTGSFGSLTPGALEMSNVDLSKEFTEMITTQRGFQSNSRVISTTDEMLQELVNLKR